MSVYEQDNKPDVNRIFISYSSIDRVRTNGLALLLEAMGHQVFHDHRTIKPGRRWKADLQEGLDDAEAVMVFWTRHAKSSDWVRKEYEYFASQYPDRLLIPVLGDETPLSELLKTRQQADFVPVVNEVLEMKRRMKKEGAGAGQIADAVRERLGEEGVEFKTGHQKRLLFLFLGFGWLLTLLRYPWSWFRKAGNAAVEKTAQASVGQVAVLGLAAVVGGGLAYPVASTAVRDDMPEDVAILEEAQAALEQENRALRAANRELAEETDELKAAARELGDLQAGITDLRNSIDELGAQLTPTACVSPQDFAACQTEITTAGNTLSRRLDDIVGMLGRPELRGAGERSPASAGGGGTREPRASVTSDLVTVPDESPPCDSGPELLVEVEPDYPESAISSDIRGDVLIRATIDANGDVATAEVASGVNESLDSAAREAMLEWKFSPCMVGDTARSVTHLFKFKYQLRD